jgi:proteasome lid subunit RPN8/RPN11
LQKIIILTDSQKNELTKHSEKNRPNESCAILFGMVENEKSIVKEIFLTENVEESSVNFTISNEQLLEAYQKAEEKKLDIIGIFHSHPDSEPRPSITDEKYMKINPVVWLIHSVTSNEFKAFVLGPEVVEISIQAQK